MLQDHPFADLACARTNERCGDADKLLMAGEVRTAENAHKRNRKCDQSETAAEQICNGGKIVYLVIGEPEYLRQAPSTGKIADCPSDQRGTSRIEQIFPHNGTLAKAHRLEDADLRALLIHHSRHRGHAHENRNGNEEDRENICYAADDTGVVLKADVACVLASRQHVSGRGFYTESFCHLGCKIVFC